MADRTIKIVVEREPKKLSCCAVPMIGSVTIFFAVVIYIAVQQGPGVPKNAPASPTVVSPAVPQPTPKKANSKTPVKPPAPPSNAEQSGETIKFE